MFSRKEALGRRVAWDLQAGIGPCEALSCLWEQRGDGRNTPVMLPQEQSSGG